MTAIPLGISSYLRTDGILPEVVCLNMYSEADGSGVSPDKILRIQRPGLTLDYTFPAPIRAAHRRPDTGRSYVVSGGILYDNRVAVGNLGDSGRVQIVSTNLGSLLLAGVVATYYTGTDFIPIALPNDAPDQGTVQAIEQLNGYYILFQPSGRFYWLVPGTTTVDPLNFATVESSPDQGIAVVRLGDELFFFGTETIEVWQATGDADAPFQRAPGRILERGCQFRDATLNFDNTIAFVGDDCNVYRVSAVPQVISDSGLSERIRKRTGDCTAWNFRLDNHAFYCLRIPGQGTFAYDAASKEWSQFQSMGIQEWAPWVGYGNADEIYAGSHEDGSFYRVTADATNDVGVAFTRILTGTVSLLGKPGRNDSFSVGTGASADCEIRLRWKDGQDDYPTDYEILEARAGLDVATLYRLGTPDQPYRTFEVSVVDDVRIRIAGAIADASWQ